MDPKVHVKHLVGQSHLIDKSNKVENSKKGDSSRLVLNPFNKTSLSPCGSNFGNIVGDVSNNVQLTAVEAMKGKFSALNKGYFDDKWIHLFFNTSMLSSTHKASPLMNRGYYSRVAIIRQCICNFIECFPGNQGIQVVNLGAGYDTLSFTILEKYLNLESSKTTLVSYANEKSKFNNNIVCFDIDFENILEIKANAMMKSAELLKLINYNDSKSANLISTPGNKYIQHSPQKLTNLDLSKLISTDRYKMVCSDIHDTMQLESALIEAGLKKEIPTIYVSECVLVYIKVNDSDSLIQWASNFCQAESAFLCYEQFNPTDPFGRTMMSSLSKSGCPLLSLSSYPTLEDQCERYKNLGWTEVRISDMNDIFDMYIDKNEIKRISQIEQLDELEEWKLIQSHYFTLMALKGPVLKNEFFLERIEKLNMLFKDGHRPTFHRLSVEEVNEGRLRGLSPAQMFRKLQDNDR